jgi:hypothetical protein
MEGRLIWFSVRRLNAVAASPESASFQISGESLMQQTASMPLGQ